MVVGYIANDRMFVVLDRFFNGEITDTALINSLSALKLGKQYVALTENACKSIQILKEQEISGKDRVMLKKKVSLTVRRALLWQMISAGNIVVKGGFSTRF